MTTQASAAPLAAFDVTFSGSERSGRSAMMINFQKGDHRLYGDPLYYVPDRRLFCVLPHLVLVVLRCYDDRVYRSLHIRCLAIDDLVENIDRTLAYRKG